MVQMVRPAHQPGRGCCVWRNLAGNLDGVLHQFAWRPIDFLGFDRRTFSAGCAIRTLVCDPTVSDRCLLLILFVDAHLWPNDCSRCLVCHSSSKRWACSCSSAYRDRIERSNESYSITRSSTGSPGHGGFHHCVGNGHIDNRPNHVGPPH